MLSLRRIMSVMDPYQNAGSGDTNLLSILMNVAFGFALGLTIFFGFKEVLAYATKLAQGLTSFFGFDRVSGFGLAASFLPYVVLAPIAGMALKQIASVRSIKGFLYFALAIALGFVIAHYTRGYFATVI